MEFRKPPSPRVILIFPFLLNPETLTVAALWRSHYKTLFHNLQFMKFQAVLFPEWSRRGGIYLLFLLSLQCVWPVFLSGTKGNLLFFGNKSQCLSNLRRNIRARQNLQLNYGSPAPIFGESGHIAPEWIRSKPFVLSHNQKSKTLVKVWGLHQLPVGGSG